jgi:hypothetical protein
MKHKTGRSIFIIFCLILLGAVGFEAGQNQTRPGQTPGVVSSPQPPVDPARQALVEQLNLYRTSGDRAGEARIWKLLEPSRTFFSGSSSWKPNDITYSPPAGNDAKSDMPGWYSIDRPIFFSTKQEADPEMACVVGSGTNYPNIIAVAEKWYDATTRDMIELKLSTDHGTSWSGGTLDIDNTYPEANPHINQVLGTSMGVAYERWYSASDPDIWFTKVATDLTSPVTYYIDDTTVYTTDPDITSDRPNYAAPYIYVVYYKRTYVGGTKPYQYDLMFTESRDGGPTWWTPSSLASFTSASSSVAHKCSINWGGVLYLAYTSAEDTSISVMKSTDWGSTWSTPVVLATGGSLPLSCVEVAAADATHAMVVYNRDFSTDRDVQYAFTLDGSSWNTNNTLPYLSGTLYNDQMYGIVTAYGGRYYAAYADYTTNYIITEDSAAATPLTWTTPLNVKSGTNAVASAPLVGSVNILAKPGPTGTAGSAAIWSQVFSSGDDDVYTDALWQPFPKIGTPIGNIAFGNVNVGNHSDLTTTIYNVSYATLTVSSVTRTSGSAYFTYQAPSTPFNLTGYTNQAITIRFTPGAGGAASATFTVSSNDPVTPTTTFTVSGTGVVVAAPDINMPVTAYDFGSVPVGIYQEVSLVVQNLGNAALTISGVPRTSGSTDFTLVSYPSSVAAGGSGTIKIGLTPTSAGARSATFTVNSNDPDEAAYPFSVAATGVASVSPVHKHAVGDFDGDGAEEFVIDFGPAGAWMRNGAVWSQLTANNPENIIAFNIDGDGDKEIAMDLGALGLWMWNSGVWSQLSVNNPEYMIATDTNNNGIDELFIDFGAQGLWWREENGHMNQVTGVNPQNIIAADIDGNGDHEVVADFGTMGIWIWRRVGTPWIQVSGLDPITMAKVDAYGSGHEGFVTSLGAQGTWLYDSGMWGQLSGKGADIFACGQIVAGGGQEIVADFGTLGVWMWSSSTWTQLSGVHAQDLTAADVDGDGLDEVVGDFGALGLWLWNGGSWQQLSGVNPEAVLAGDVDADNQKELIVDFGSLGLWMWNNGAWTQLSGNNPD